MNYFFLYFERKFGFGCSAVVCFNIYYPFDDVLWVSFRRKVMCTWTFHPHYTLLPGFVACDSRFCLAATIRLVVSTSYFLVTSSYLICLARFINSYWWSDFRLPKSVVAFLAHCFSNGVTFIPMWLVNKFMTDSPFMLTFKPAVSIFQPAEFRSKVQWLWRAFNSTLLLNRFWNCPDKDTFPVWYHFFSDRTN